MTQIIEGMTPTQFINAVNANAADVLSNYTVIDNTMNGLTLQTNLNYGFGTSYSFLGMRGSSYANIINSNFNVHDISISKPMNHSVAWMNDFARNTFTDHSGGTAQHELWESKNGGAYSLVYIFSPGNATYDYLTWQNANLNFKIRAKNGSLYSPFTSVTNITTPLVFKTNQSTPAVFTIHQLRMTTNGKSVTIYWGDGANTVYNHTNWEYDVITHTYTVPQNPYYIQIFGDTDDLANIEMFGLAGTVYGNIGKWILPTKLTDFHFYSNGFTGDVTNWVLPVNATLFDVGGNSFTGDITSWVNNFPASINDFHVWGNGCTGDITNFKLSGSGLWLLQLMEASLSGNITNWSIPPAMSWLDFRLCNYVVGNISNWNIPSNLSSLQFTDVVYQNPILGISGDLTNWNFPTTVNANYGFYWDFWGMTGITGDLSAKLIPVGVATGKIKRIDFTNSGITKMPSGSFKDTNVYSFGGCNCNTTEVDRILSVIDVYFVGGVVPLVNCVYTLNGTGMGIPSAAGLASRTSILNKYTAAGKTATIAVNS